MTELVRTYKLTDSGAWGWVTEEAEGGGGGSLPSWWTVDSTPGSESVEFAGAVTISTNGGFDTPLYIRPTGVTGAAAIYVDGSGSPDLGFLLELDSIDGPAAVTVGPTGAVTISPSDPNATALEIRPAAGATDNQVTEIELYDDVGTLAFYVAADGGTTVNHVNAFAQTKIVTPGGGTWLQVDDEALLVGTIRFTADSEMAFFGGPPAAQPTGVAVSTAAMHAALVSLNLFTA